jgi:hypothetical protein
MNGFHLTFFLKDMNVGCFADYLQIRDKLVTSKGVFDAV